MAKFSIGDTILVPSSALDWDDAPVAMVERQVVDQQARKVKVGGKPGDGERWVASRRAHTDIHVLVLRLGDIDSEDTLLDPITDSLHQHLRLLLTDARVAVWRIRTMAELKHWWSKDHAIFTHVILVCHGREDALKVVGDTPWLAGGDLAVLLDQWGPQSQPKEFLSVGCMTGRAGFAKALSKAACARRVVAPYQTVHGSVALSYCHQYFGSLLLDGVTTKNARNKAARSLPGGSHFVTWTDGKKGK